MKKQYVPILMYHSISKSSNPRFAQFAVPASAFAEQMAYLCEHGYTPLTVTQLARMRTIGNALPEKPVVLTFDDGFADFFTAALPVLRRYDFAATLYVATAYVEKTSAWLQKERETARAMLTWDQLREICASGIECGGHTQSHPQLDTLPLPQAREEIYQCKQIIEEQLEQKIYSFAYPYGYQTAAVRQLVQIAGYLSACAVKHRMSVETDDPFALARLMVHGQISLNEFTSLLAGDDVSPVSAMYRFYTRARTPVWQMIRRGNALLTHVQEKR